MIEIYPMTPRAAETIAMTITKYPEQKPNTREAFDRLVFDYSLSQNRRPVGTLSEIHEFVNNTMQNNNYKIMCSNGVMFLHYNDNKFIIDKTVVSRRAVKAKG